MATVELTASSGRLLHGSWNGTSWSTVTPVVLNVAAFNREVWGQWDFTQAGVLAITSVDFRFAVDAGAVGSPFTLDLLLFDGPLTADFSDTNTPAGPREVISSFLTVTPTSTTVDTSLSLHTTEGQSTATLHVLRAAHPDDSTGVRRVGLGMRLNDNSATSPLNGVELQRLSITGEGQFTGIEGPYQAYGRADECPKCGGKSTRDTWVRDGYTDMMVCSECYDEEDLVGRHYQGLGSERPGQGEG